LVNYDVRSEKHQKTGCFKKLRCGRKPSETL